MVLKEVWNAGLLLVGWLGGCWLPGGRSCHGNAEWGLVGVGVMLLL